MRAKREPPSEHDHDADADTVKDRRILRGKYLAVKNLICGERDDLGKVDSDKFGSIFNQVETLHQKVQKPREQVADAEALLDITSTLVASVKSHTSEGVSPSDFVTRLLSKFGGGSNGGGVGSTFSWSNVGVAVPHIFMDVRGCQTMIGPMDTEIKQRRAVVQRQRTRPSESTRRPEELGTQQETKSDTDKNMATMFDVLRKKKNVKLENLVLNRASFAQTVENVFSLSFLVKDGRASISVNESGHHFVSPRNAPAANSVATGHVSYTHFVFRFDFKDWKLMSKTVRSGEELMPHRSSATTSELSTEQPPSHGSESGAPSTPIRKLSRNRGLVIQENVVDATSERDISDRGKRRRLYKSP